MNASWTRLLLWTFLALALMAMSCSYSDEVSGPVQTEARSVALGKAKSVRVEVSMGAGELKLAGGATELLDADFTYTSPRWKPEVDYSVSGDRGTLRIRQPEGGSAHGGQYKWDLRLNNKVPIELVVHLGAGKTDLALGTLSLHEVEVNMGVGETVVDLTGDWTHDVKASIHGGIGKATVRLPRDVGVKVYARGGIGEIRRGDLMTKGDAYVNDVYGKSPVTVLVDVQGGIGEINLKLGEGPVVI